MHRDRRRGVQLGAQCGVRPSADPLARLERQVHWQREEHAEEHHKGLEDLRLEGLLHATDADRLELEERLGADDAARARDEATASGGRAAVRNRKALGEVEVFWHRCATASGSAVEARAAPAYTMNTIALEASHLFSSAPPIVHAVSSSARDLRAVSAVSRASLRPKSTERTQIYSRILRVYSYGGVTD